MAKDPLDLGDRREFAAELTAVRERAGLTIREVAAKLDVPTATLGGYFGGGHLPAAARAFNAGCDPQRMRGR